MSFLRQWRQRRAAKRAARHLSDWEVNTGDLLALMRAGQKRRGVDLNEPTNG